MHVAKSVLLAVQQQPFVVARAHASSLLGRIASRVARQETLATVTPLLLATGGSRNCWNAVLSSSSTWTSSSLLLLHSMPSKLRTSSFSTISTTTKTIYSARSLAIAETTRRRIHPNMARLYARRILELAAASAAAHVAVVQLEKSSTRKEPPVNWHNWRDGGGREWSTELLQVLGANAWTRWWAATRRIVTLSCLVLPYTCVLLPLSLCSTTLHDLSWQYALWGIEQAGPTYIKLVQWATTRHDLFSPEFCKTFSKLQDRTEGHSWQQTLDILSQDWNLPPPTTTTSSLLQSPTDTANVFQQKSTDLISKSKVLVATTNKTTTESANATANANDVIDINSYLSMDREPVGSGCIAQVYHGTLRQAVGNVPAGTEVAVKVQHPDIWHKVCVDFFIMGIVAQWLEALPYANLKYLSLVDSVRKFRNIMLPQLDLTIEASNLARFNRDFSADPTVTFPQPINELTTPRVLLETFVHGTPILQYARNAPEAERKELALMGLNTTLKMIFLHDFLHGKCPALHCFPNNKDRLL